MQHPSSQPALRALLRLCLVFGLAATLVILTLSLASAEGLVDLARLTFASGSDRISEYASISADGTRIAFDSDSDFLGQGIALGQSEIWLYDTTTMTVTRLTEASRSTRYSTNASISADGTRVAFDSDSDFFGQGIVQHQREIWLYDTATMTLTRVTTASHSNRESGYPSVNADGTKIAFESDSDFLGEGIPYQSTQIWLYDVTTSALTRLTSSQGSSDRISQNASINADGTRIVFESDSDLLGQGIPQDQPEIWLFDTNTMTVTRVTTASNVDRLSLNASISSDGTKIAFDSDSDFFGQGISPNQTQVWLYNTLDGSLEQLTTATFTGTARYSNPCLSGNGQRVAFLKSYFTNPFSIVTHDWREEESVNVWLYDVPGKHMVQVSTTIGWGPRYSLYPSLNEDGVWITFDSDSDLLEQGVASWQAEIWLAHYDPEFAYVPVVFGASQ